MSDEARKRRQPWGFASTGVLAGSLRWLLRNWPNVLALAWMWWLMK